MPDGFKTLGLPGEGGGKVTEQKYGGQRWPEVTKSKQLLSWIHPECQRHPGHILCPPHFLFTAQPKDTQGGQELQAGVWVSGVTGCSPAFPKVGGAGGVSGDARWLRTVWGHILCLLGGRRKEPGSEVKGTGVLGHWVLCASKRV